MVKLDYIIVGQGIAGTMMAYFLLRMDKKVLVIDHFDPSSSSNVAGGIINPITGRKMVRTWKADELLPFARQTYEELEEQLGHQYFFSKKIIKLFASPKEQNEWLAKLEDENISKYAKEFNKKKKYSPYINIGNGGVILKGGGYVDLKNLVIDFRERLRVLGILIGEEFHYKDLEISKKKVKYKDWKAKHIIFCEGYRAMENPWFSWLPFAVTKGELLHIRSEELPEDKIINKKYWILPVGDHIFKVGATYSWDDPNEEPTQEARAIIMDHIKKVLKVPYEIIEHEAGVRPNVKDRRPLLGRHPEYPQVVIFNGLGSKGASLAPYFASHLIDHLEEGTPLDEEVDIRRWEKEQV